jgi:hypothetical protein
LNAELFQCRRGVEDVKKFLEGNAYAGRGGIPLLTDEIKATKGRKLGAYTDEWRMLKGD